MKHRELLDGLAFGRSAPMKFPKNDGWIHFMKASKTIKIELVDESVPVTITIDSKQLKSVKVFDVGPYCVYVMHLFLESPPSIETCSRYDSTKFEVNFIEVVFASGFHKRKLTSLLLETFEIIAEIEKSKTGFYSDCDSDSDLEMEEIESPSTIEVSSSSTPVKRSKTPSIDPKYSRIPSFIPTKEIKADESPKQHVKRRTCRRAAEIAKAHLKESLDESENESFGDTVKQKKTKKSSKKSTVSSNYPELNLRFFKSDASRKQQEKWSIENNIYVDDDPETPLAERTTASRPKVESPSVQLTPTNFRKSLVRDPAEQRKRILENVMKINENAPKTNAISSNVSYSYRALTSSRMASKASGSNSTAPVPKGQQFANNGHENSDVENEVDGNQKHSKNGMDSKKQALAYVNTNKRRGR